jgi:hypothetical protein
VLGRGGPRCNRLSTVSESVVDLHQGCVPYFTSTSHSLSTLQHSPQTINKMYKKVENSIRHLEGHIRDMELSQVRAVVQWPDLPILDQDGDSSIFWVPGKGLMSKSGTPTKGLFKLSRHMPKIGLRTTKANLANPLVTDSAAGGSPYKQERLTGSRNNERMARVASVGGNGREVGTIYERRLNYAN